MNNPLKKISALFATLIVLAACTSAPAVPGKYADAAKCLTQKGVIMYGAYWCPHCAAQKKDFADDFQFVHYQECDPKGPNGDKAICLAAGVTSYPTWIFPGQGALVGEQQVRDLAKLANCDDKLPADDQQKLKDEAKAVVDANAQAATTSTAPATTTPAPTNLTGTVAPATSAPAATTPTVTATPAEIVPSATVPPKTTK